MTRHVPCTPSEIASFHEHDAVSEALRPYIDAARSGNGASMRGVWFDHARIVGLKDGKLVNLDPDAFCRWVDSEGGSADVQARIASIQICGRAASARVEFLDWHGARFTDFFVLLKHNSHWLISGKVFDSHGRND